MDQKKLFANKMNEKARELGLKNSNFTELNWMAR